MLKLEDDVKGSRGKVMRDQEVLCMHSQCYFSSLLLSRRIHLGMATRFYA